VILVSEYVQSNNMLIYYSLCNVLTFLYCPYLFIFFWGNAVALLVQALCYKPEGRGFDSRLGHWIFSNLPNPSSRNMALGLTRPLTEMSSRKISGGYRAAGA
jgi:hypothetical protein